MRHLFKSGFLALGIFLLITACSSSQTTGSASEANDSATTKAVDSLDSTAKASVDSVDSIAKNK